MIKLKKSYKIILMAALISAFTYATAFAETKVLQSGELSLKKVAGFSVGTVSEEGGAAEINKYNKDNNKVYVINGVESKIFVASLDQIQKEKEIPIEKIIDVKPMVVKDGFEYGDITSIAISNNRKEIAVSVQANAHNANGKIVIMDYDGNLKNVYEAGVQPDMITYTPDSKYLLTANEGESRKGLGPFVHNPEGTVTIVDLEKGTSKLATFDKFDNQRNKLVKKGVLIAKGSTPSQDFEPEYMVVDSNSKKAYITLQENNAIATLDIESGEFDSVDALGFKDLSKEENSIDVVKDGKVNLRTENLYAAYMPDSISIYEANGKKYLLTANEGDGREYTTEEFSDIQKENEYNNIGSKEIDGQKVQIVNKDVVDGLPLDKDCLFGGRSFSIWDADTMKLVFDSGSDMERLEAEMFPEYFNCSNDDIKIDSRSGKKGPEVEEVKVKQIGEKTYAFVGLERIGGVAVYDITDPSNSKCVTYLNTRDFSSDMAGDVSPECIDIISAENSSTGKPLVVVSNEVSGTVSILEIEK